MSCSRAGNWIGCSQRLAFFGEDAGSGRPCSGRNRAGVDHEIGPDLVFGRLWRRWDWRKLSAIWRRARRHEFDLERAVYLTVLHRLFASGSDRAAEAMEGKLPDRGSGGIELASTLPGDGLAGTRKSVPG